MRKTSILKGALILTAAGIITRILGFVYRIYMSNLIGAEGMGLYQLIVPVYTLAWSIACSGFTTTISKLTAAERAKGEYGNMGRILKQSIVITTSIAALLTLLLFNYAEYIAATFFDPRISLSLKILSFAFVFMAAGSCIRGYFFGLQETMVPAINQVLEQTVRMTVIYLLAGIFIPMGLEYACAAAVIGIVAEEIFSMIYVIIAYKKFKTKNTLNKRPSLASLACLAMIFTTALPLTASRVTGSFLVTLENMLIPQRLQLYGFSNSEAMSIFGQITGMAMPLIMFPSAFLVSLSITLVPAVSEASAVKNFKRIHSTASKSLLFASVIGFGAAALFIVFAKELGMVIYNQDISHMLLLLGAMCPFIYMHVVISGILNGLGFQVFLFRNSLISSAITICFVYFLVPYIGINAFIFGWFAALVLIITIEIEKLRASVDLHFEFLNWFLKPLLSGAAAALCIKLISGRLLVTLLGDKIALIVSVCMLGIVYLFLVVATGCISRKELYDLLAPLNLGKWVREKSQPQE